jgi:HEAT repeat protein
VQLLSTSAWVDARRAAAKSLGQLGDPAAVAPLEVALAKETDAWAISEEIAAIAAIGGPEGKAALQRVAATHPVADARGRATAELGKLP